MKRLQATVKAVFAALILVFVSVSFNASGQGITGPEGNISYTVLLPEGFNPATDRCPMVVLMHGIFSNKGRNPGSAIAKALAKEGIASIRFDFNGHGKSDGRTVDMTIDKEIADAMAVWEYVKALPYVSKIGILGHSQGGVIASMTAGMLAGSAIVPEGVVLMAPGSIIKDACQAGRFFNARFDPANPPDHISCFGLFKLGKDYLTSTQTLDIFGTAALYTGPVLILHGSQDGIVPIWCSEKYNESYGDHARLVVIDKENHRFTRRRKEAVREVVSFFTGLFGK